MAASIHREEVSVRHLLDEYTGLPPHLSYYYGEGSSQFEEFDFSRGERYRPNPNMIAAYRYTFRIPLNPVASGVTINATTVNLTVGDNTDFPLGPAGVALDGVALFNPLAAPGDDIEDEKYTFDSNEGHPQQQGAYHYHAVAVGPLAVLQAPGSVTSQSPGTAEIELYGVMCDGTVVMGAKELDGSEAASDLDLQADGQLAHYVTSGETGPAIILLHGGIEGSSGTAGWRFMAPFLGANGSRVFCPDRPGFGLSDKTKVEYLERGKKAQVDFVSKFADALGLKQFHISGNSAGCTVSCDYVISHPERVLSVAFIAGGPGDITEQPRIPPAGGKFTPNPEYVSPGFDGTEDSMRYLMEGIIYEPKAIWPELITMRVKAALGHRAAREAAGLPPVAGVGGPPPLEPNVAQLFTTINRLDKLTTPMICMYGLQDVLIPVENGFNQEDSAPNVQFFFTDECGHQGQTDQPEIFDQTFLEFFRDGKVSWKTAVDAGVSRRREIDGNLVEHPAGGFPKPVREAYTEIESLRAALGAAAPP